MVSPTCPVEFTADLRALLIAALRRAYDEAAILYAPQRGIGDRVHAIAVYDAATFAIEQTASDLPHVSFVSRGQGPELWVDGFRLRWNKVGRGDRGESIGSSFPRGSRTAVEMALDNKQMTLWDDVGDVTPTNWILCHLGNPRDGLRAVYLAAPIEADGVRVSGWRNIVPIWSADDPTAEFPDAPSIGLPEAVELPELDIALLDEPREQRESG